MVSQCLRAAGIRAVVWIDDYFAPPTRDELSNAIQDYIFKLKEMAVAKVDLVPFDEIDLRGPKNDVEDALADVLQDMPDGPMGEAAIRFAVLCGRPPPRSTPQADDLSPEEFEALRITFGEGLRTFSLGRWTSAGAQEYATASADTLFLIDKEFKREDAGFDGTTILA